MFAKFAKPECHRWTPYFWEYVTERLPEAQRANVERHLNACADCRREAAQYRQALMLTAQAQQQTHPVSQASWETVRTQLQHENAASSQHRLPQRLRYGQWAGAGLALAGLAGVAVWIQRVPDQHPAAPAITLNSVHPQPFVNTPAMVAQDPPAARQEPAFVPLPVLRLTVGSPGRKPAANKSGVQERTDPALQLPNRNRQLPEDKSRLLPGIDMVAEVRQTVKPGLQTASIPQDDLAYLNASPDASIGRWTSMSSEKTVALEAEVTRLLANVRQGDAFVSVPFPQIAGQGKPALRAAVRAYQQEKAVVDTRLAHKIRRGVKAAPLSALLRQITDETGIALTANPRVADDNVTIFCHERPLRDIMRQLSEHFGFQWLREGGEGAYRYELTQSVRSQLREEELRNQDQDEALVALDHAMEKYRAFRGLDMDHLHTLETKLPPKEAVNLFPLMQGGWLPANLYFGLSPEDMQILRSGQPLNFAMSSENGGRALPETLRPDVLKSFEGVRIDPHPKDGHGAVTSFNPPPDSLPLSAAKAIEITSELHLDRSQLGQFTLKGDIFLQISTEHSKEGIGHGITLAEVTSPATAGPQNALANAKRAQDADLQPRVTVEPEASCKLTFGPRIPDVEGISQELGPKCTTGDVLEAIFKATGKDVIGDFYTRLYVPGKVTETSASVFDVLNRLGDAMHERWSRADGWLTFRSTSWFYDRPKEVPARKLARWSASRREHGALTLDDLTEIGQLTDTQLDALTIFQGALARYNLQEWNYARSTNLRNHWRFLAAVPADMRLALMNGKELQADKLPLNLQKRFIPLALHDPDTDTRPGSRDVAKASLRIEYPAGHIPADRPDFKPLMPGNPIIFLYKYAEPEKGFGQRTTVIGPFNAVIGGSEAMTEQMRARNKE